MLIDCVPQTKFGRDSTIEPVENWQAIATLRGRGQTEHLNRPYVVQHCPIGIRRGVMEFIDDHDIESVRVSS
jgi:hypothetical protein